VVLAEVARLTEVNVYGLAVPGAEGRAGMAGIVAGAGFDLKALGRNVASSLPAYARPVFVRLKREIQTTGTFKYRKLDLVQQGFDPARVDGEPLYIRNAEDGYDPLTPELYASIMAEDFRF